MQPYSPHQLQSGAVAPPGEMPSMSNVPDSLVAEAQAAVDASVGDERQVLDVPRQPMPGLSGS